MVDVHDQRVLNAAVREAVDFVHAEGWDQPATLFALVPTQLVADFVGDGPTNPLSLIVQEDLPGDLPPGSEELGQYIASVRWPDQVVGAVLAQEITFVNSAAGAEPAPQQARLFSGVTADEDGSGQELTVLQLRPTDEELEANPFAQDKVELLGGEDIAPGVVATLRATFEESRAGVAGEDY
ncbi:MAG TPA: hypothetical protein H9867_04030 [Candidatus Corynebacterium gallistercoris]|uniref:Uncharacterized protein n=1 Tax=Candidatus Corynebacterium gallistercoris TaxID=2838530 RepID=A0A9D1RXN5_9CORY|nr:hypothetical protein [Candidatus Corynebacterium gallistercoris]